jgi:hypothetical protein
MTPSTSSTASSQASASPPAGWRPRTGAHRPRRRTGPAVAVVLLLVVAAAAVVGVRALGQGGFPSAGGTSPGTPAAAASATTARSPSPTPAESPSGVPSESASPGTSSTAEQTAEVDRSAAITVLNATRRAGLATGVAATLRSAGWSVVSTGNYRQDAPPTTVYYSGSALRATARAVSQDLPGAQQVVRSTRFGDPAVTVVIGADYSG